jgi:DNA-binding PadR family transcriptional regulator
MWAYGWGSRRHRGLRVWVLQMLERGPMNGAEIMDQMDRMTMGWWRPSPGSIYPLLEELEKERLVTKEPDGRYRLTETAHGGPDWMRELGFGGLGGPRSAEEATRSLEGYLRFLEDVARSDPARVAEVTDRLRAVARGLERVAETAAPAR